jgi:hypothetical protein
MLAGVVEGFTGEFTFVFEIVCCAFPKKHPKNTVVKTVINTFFILTDLGIKK